MLIPETRWTHAILLSIRSGGAGALIVSGRKMHFLVVVRWPWATPLNVNRYGNVSHTRCLSLDFRANPVPIEEIEVNGKTVLDFVPEVG